MAERRLRSMLQAVPSRLQAVERRGLRKGSHWQGDGEQLAPRLHRAIHEEFFKEPKDLPRGEVHDVADTIVLPKDIPAGEYALSIGVVGLDGEEPVVQLGIKGQEEDGWYPVSTLEVGR